MGDAFWGFLSAVVVMAIVYMLVKPSSRASQAVVAATNTLAGFVSLAIKGSENQ